MSLAGIYPIDAIRAIEGKRFAGYTMTYKGYSARIEYDDEDGIITGQIAGIRDGVGFHADSVEKLKEAFHEADLPPENKRRTYKLWQTTQKSYSV